MQEKNVEYITSDGSFYLSHTERTGHFSMTDNHCHDNYEIYYLLSGERYYFIKNRTIQIKAGDIVFININELHRTIDSGISCHERILINFKEEFILTKNHVVKVLLRDIFDGGNSVVRLPVDKRNHIEIILFKMLQEVKCGHMGYEVLVQSLLLEFFVYVSRNLKDNLINSLQHPSPMHKKVSQIVQYINNNYMKSLTLSIISESFHVSPYHLTRIFKQATGFTFIEYLNSIRIQEAKALLRESRYKVIEIAEKVGFLSLTNFGRVFKALTGTTPLNYRRMNKN